VGRFEKLTRLPAISSAWHGARLAEAGGMTRSVCVLLAFVLGACSFFGQSSPPDAMICGYSGGSGYQLRDPETGQCESIGSGCDPCAGGCPAEPALDWATCQGACDTLTESQCLANDTCHAGYLDSAFWGCFDLPPSGAMTGGGCTGLDDQTCSEHPDCVSDYSDGGSGSAYAQYSACAPTTPLPACSTLTTAATCTARADCEPIYDGSNCTCTPSNCTCQTETFDHCQAN
jgi:hypothetical protein